MYNVKDVMTDSVQTIEPEATLAQAASWMNELGVGALPVRDGNCPAGMITDRDITVRATAKGLVPGPGDQRRGMVP